MFFVLLTMASGTSAFATEIFELHRTARAMGMGNAFTSLVDDEDSLFYNPAGIAKNGGFFWTLADPGVGASSGVMDDVEAFSDLQDDSTFQSALNDLSGKTIWIGARGKTAIMLPFFAGALYTAGDVSVRVNNPVNPTLTLNYVRDTGIAVGTGFWVGPFMQMGFVGKRITRTGSRQDFGPSVISEIISGSGSTDDIFNSIENQGVGYALDFGTNFTLPGPVNPTLSFVWKNIGNTKFVPADADDLAPPTEIQEWVIGSSLLVDLPLVHIVPSLDFKHINNEDEQLGKKVHMGVELGLPLVDLRVGLNQGYLSYGAGVNLGIFRVDAAKWKEELGAYPGQLASDRIMVQFSLRLGFDLGIGQGSSKSGSSGKGGKGGGSSGSKSFWGGSHKLKQRR
jgi:hypothetical protein